MATLKDVARLSGVTVTTISRMLNNRVNVSEKTRARILAAMEELDYHPNELAQSLIRQKSSFRSWRNLDLVICPFVWRKPSIRFLMIPRFWEDLNAFA